MTSDAKYIQYVKYLNIETFVRIASEVWTEPNPSAAAVRWSIDASLDMSTGPIAAPSVSWIETATMGEATPGYLFGTSDIKFEDTWLALMDRFDNKLIYDTIMRSGSCPLWLQHVSFCARVHSLSLRSHQSRPSIQVLHHICKSFPESTTRTLIWIDVFEIYDSFMLWY